MAGHTKQAATMNARCASTRSTLNLKPANRPVHTPVLKPPSLLEKTCFLPASGAGHADWGTPRSCIFRSPMLLLEECTVARTSLEVARCASHGGAVTLLLLLFAGTIFCEFLRFGKNRKIKYPQKFLPTHQAPWCVYHHKLRDVFHFGSCIIILFRWSLLFFSTFTCHHDLEKVTFDDIDDRGSFTSKP